MIRVLLTTLCLAQDPPPNARFAMRLLALCCVGRTDLVLDVAPLRLRSNRLAALPKTKIRTARARIRWRILVAFLPAIAASSAHAQRGSAEVIRFRSVPEAEKALPLISTARSRPPAPPAIPLRARPRVMLTGYWPPTNEMIRRFSPDPDLNPQGWIGGNWEGRGFDVFAYFPEFDPPDCQSCGKGEGDLEVDYQDTSRDGRAISDTLRPIAVITFSRGFDDLSWEVELNQFNRTTWIGDYEDPREPTPSPPDPTVPADALRLSALPVQGIVDAVEAADLGLDPFVAWTGDGGGFLSEFAAYHGVWYQAYHASPQDPDICVAGGHVHVGGQIDWETATLAAAVTLRTVIDYVDGLIRVETCQDDVGYKGPGTATLTLCGDALSSGGRAELILRNAPAGSVAWLVLGSRLAPKPYMGGRLAPDPPNVVATFETDALGQIHFGPIPGGRGPALRYLQMVYEDYDYAQGRGFSNTLRVELLP